MLTRARPRPRTPVLPLLLAAATMALPAPASTAPATRPSSTAGRAAQRELDHAQALLRERLEALPDGSGVVVRRDLDRVTLQIPARLLFDPDSAALKRDALLSVPFSAALRLLKKRHDLSAQIEVYTDSVGGAIANQTFALRRAQSIFSAFGAAGIPMSRLREHGAGATAALASNETPQGRIENRRVEIVFARALAPPATTPSPATVP